ncbi:hypothetical protein LJC31_00330 [Synergistaceae bacterium OttesenSCG-928-I11]|nr:hypothetical protein [Synergistaceae bacterium OttesenSCG-928-I11]
MLAQKTRREAIQEAVERLLAEERTTEENERYRYAKAVVLAFDEIRMLLGRGIRFDRICKSFETSGLLPVNASVHSLRVAFRRECKRRGEIYPQTKTNREKALGEKKTVANKVLPRNGQTIKNEPEKNDADSTKDMVRKMGAVTVETGSGKITKYPDGGFDF